MSRYDGLIIPRSYSEYLNKTDSATLSQMLQHLTGLWSHAVSAGDQKPVTSDAVQRALGNYRGILEKRVTISKGNGTHTIVTLNTNGAYLLHASGNNYGDYLGFVTNGYNSGTKISEINHLSISAVVSGFRTLDFTSFAVGDIDLSIIKL